MTPTGTWPSGTTTSSPDTTVTRFDGPAPGQSAWVEAEVSRMAAAWRNGGEATADEVLARHPGIAGEAAVRLTLRDDGERCQVRMEEQIVRGPGTFIPRPLRDVLLKWRNVESLRRLAYLVERRQQDGS